MSRTPFSDTHHQPPSGMEEETVPFTRDEGNLVAKLRSLIAEGDEDVAAGRVVDFDMDDIIGLAKQKARAASSG